LNVALDSIFGLQYSEKIDTNVFYTSSIFVAVLFTLYRPMSFQLLLLQLMLYLVDIYLPSVLWCCWLAGRKGIWPVNFNFN